MGEVELDALDDGLESSLVLLALGAAEECAELGTSVPCVQQELPVGLVGLLVNVVLVGSQLLAVALCVGLLPHLPCSGEDDAAMVLDGMAEKVLCECVACGVTSGWVLELDDGFDL